MKTVVGVAGVTRPNRAAPVRLHPGAAVALCLAALAMQVFLPIYLPLVGMLDLPLLAVVYVALLRRNVLAGMLAGLLVGLAQDGLTHGPIGLFGIIKSVIGYAAAAVSLLIEVDYPGARVVLAAAFFLAHQILFWTLQGALLGGALPFDPARTLILSATHAGLALLIFRALDVLRPTA